MIADKEYIKDQIKTLERMITGYKMMLNSVPTIPSQEKPKVISATNIVMVVLDKLGITTSTDNVKAIIEEVDKLL